MGHPDFGKTIACPQCTGTETPEQQERGEQRMGIPVAYQDAMLDRLSNAQRAAIAPVIAEHPEKPFLILHGNVGAGKTFAAVAAIREVRRRYGRHCAFWPVVSLLERYRATFDADRAMETSATIDAELRRAHVLVLDDFGKQKSTEWAQQQIYRLVNERWSSRRGLIVTTNVNPDDFDEAVRSRLWDRQIATAVQFAGTDRRAK